MEDQDEVSLSKYFSGCVTREISGSSVKGMRFCNERIQIPRYHMTYTDNP